MEAYRRDLLKPTDNPQKVDLVISFLFIDHEKFIREKELGVLQAAVASGRASTDVETRLNKSLSQLDSLGCGSVYIDRDPEVNAKLDAWYTVLQNSGYFSERAAILAKRRKEIIDSQRK